MDYSGLRERQVLYAVSVPGETDWYKQSQDALSSPASSVDSLASRVQSLNVNNSQTSVSALSHKYPIPEEKHTGALIKLYPYSNGKAGIEDQPYKATEIVDFIGVLDYTPFPTSAAEDQTDAAASEPITANELVKTLHVVMTVPTIRQSVLSPPSSPVRGTASAPPGDEAQEARKELVAYLASALDGDSLAAEWLLLSLLGKMLAFILYLTLTQQTLMLCLR